MLSRGLMNLRMVAWVDVDHLVTQTGHMNLILLFTKAFAGVIARDATGLACFGLSCY